MRLAQSRLIPSTTSVLGAIAHIRRRWTTIYCDESHLRPDYVREYITYLDDMVLLDKVPLVSSGLALASIRK